MTIKELSNAFWNIWPRKLAKPSLKKVFTPFSHLLPNILWILLVSSLCFFVWLCYEGHGFRYISSMLILILMASAFCGLLLQMIRPVRLKSGPKPSRQLDKRHHPFRFRKQMKAFDALMEKAYADNKNVAFDTNMIKALTEALYISGALKKDVTNKEILAGWISTHYSSLCKNQFSGKVIMKATPEDDIVEKADKLLEAMKMPNRR